MLTESTLIEDLTQLRLLMNDFNKMKKQIDELKESVMEQIKKEHPQGLELPDVLKPYRRVDVAVSQRSGFVVEATEFEILKWGKKRKPKKKKK
tara:strand:- start:982 stop:1260 length:279 start_codon:yes stop_codon:yes gene_type:complete